MTWDRSHFLSPCGPWRGPSTRCYAAFGQELSRTENEENRFTYQTNWYVSRSDDGTEVYLVSPTRLYDPDEGRFIGRDPLRDLEKMGLYVYVGNNPVISVDVRGLQPRKKKKKAKEIRGGVRKVPAKMVEPRTPEPTTETTPPSVDRETKTREVKPDRSAEGEKPTEEKRKATEAQRSEAVEKTLTEKLELPGTLPELAVKNVLGPLAVSGALKMAGYATTAAFVSGASGIGTAVVFGYWWGGTVLPAAQEKARTVGGGAEFSEQRTEERRDEAVQELFDVQQRFNKALKEGDPGATSSLAWQKEAQRAALRRAQEKLQQARERIP